MSWLQINIATPEKNVEQISTFLNLLGAASVTLLDAADQPILEPALGTTPLWTQTVIAALFAAEVDADQIIGFLKKQLGAEAITHYHTEHITDKNWERAWLDNFHPMQFGENLWVCPSVIDPPNPNAVNIILDPGLAFGTGTHPTTALCLQWLDANPPHHKTVIDYGCGSGILAIAALKLGAQHVFAVDHDEQALEATLQNAKRNHIDPQHLSVYLPEHQPECAADVLLANILANPLLELAPRFAKLVKPGGQLVLSGIFVTQIAMLQEAYAPWFSFTQNWQEGDWACVEGLRFPLSK